MAVHHLKADDLIFETKARKQRRKRRVSLSNAMAQATKAEVSVSGATLNADGSVSLTFGTTTPNSQNGSGAPHQQLKGWDDLQ
jgi:hypothetical protein